MLSFNEMRRQKCLLIFKAQLNSYLLHESCHQLQHNLLAFLSTMWEIIVPTLILLRVCAELPNLAMPLEGAISNFWDRALVVVGAPLCCLVN